MDRSTKFWIATAFLTLAGIGLARGYAAQSKTDVPPSKTAYSRSNATFSGHVGTPKEGLEYKVDFPKANVHVGTKVEDIYASANFNAKTGKTKFYGETDLKDGERLKAETSFKGEDSKTKVDYKKFFKDFWLADVGLAYTESLGTKKESIFNATVTFNIPNFGFVEWTPGYDFKNKEFDLGRLRRS